jgi:hypothetical protein
MSIAEHEAELASIVEKYSASLRERLARFHQIVAKTTAESHVLTKPSLSESHGSSPAGSPLRPASLRDSPVPRYKEEPLFQRRVPTLEERLQGLLGDRRGQPSLPFTALPDKAVIAPVPSQTAAAAAWGSYASCAAAPSSAAAQLTVAPNARIPSRPGSSTHNPRAAYTQAVSALTTTTTTTTTTCPIPLMHQDLVLKDKHQRLEDAVRASTVLVPGAVSAPEEFGSPPLLTVDVEGTLPSVAPDIVVQGADQSTPTAAPVLLVDEPDHDGAEHHPNEPIPRQGVQSLGVNALVAVAAIRARRRASDAAALSAFGGYAGASAAPSRRGSVAGDGVSRAASFVSHSTPGGMGGTAGTEDGQQHPLEAELEALRRDVRTTTNAVQRLQQEARHAGVPNAAIEAAMRGKPVDDALQTMEAQLAMANRAAVASATPPLSGGSAAVAPAVAMPPSDALSTSGVRVPSPGPLVQTGQANSLTAGKTVPYRGRAPPPKLAASTGPTQRPPPAAKSSAGSPSKASTKARSGLEFTLAAAEAFFDDFVRDANVAEIEQAVREVEEELKSHAAGQVPQAVTQLASTIVVDAKDLLARLVHERTVFLTTVKSMERVAKRERKEAETAVERLGMRLETMEDRVVHLVRDQLVDEGKISYLPPEDDEYDDGGIVERSAPEETVDGISVSHVAIHCGLATYNLDRALQTLHSIADKERMVHACIEHMEALIAETDHHNQQLEREISCGNCGVVRDENFALWPCGHAFCGPCIFETQNDRGEFVCPACEAVTLEVPVPNSVINMLASRVIFKRCGARDVRTAVQHFRTQIQRIDDAFARETDTHYRNVPVSDEFVSLREARRRALA